MAQRDYSNYVIPATAALMLVLFGKKIMSSFSFFGGNEAEQQAVAQLQASNVFSPNYWQGKSGVQLTTIDYAKQWCQNVYNAKGTFNDDEAAVYGAFNALHYKTQVSWMAYNFYKIYGKDLYGYLQGFLSTGEMAQIAAIVNKLK